MNCVTDEMFAAWVSGEADVHELERIWDHAADCVSCRSLALAMFGLAPRPRPTGPTIGAVGATIGRYRVTAPLGHGAMGIVLRGHDPVLARDVAIKMINATATSAEQRARMLDEAKLLAVVDHPNVVRVHDAGIVDGEVFVAMEYVVGATLVPWLAEAPRPVSARLAVLSGVGAGIAAIHAAGVVHRDIKPDNIVVRGERGVIVDFGLARAADVTGAVGSGIVGTPRFIAPEVGAGRPATALADQFAWWTVVDDTLRDAALPARRRRALTDAIARGRALDPERRFATMDDAIAALDAACGPRPRGRWPLVVGAGAAAAVAIAVVWATARDPRDACAVEPPRTWSPARRGVIATRLIAAGVAANAVLGELDARAERTAAVRAHACHDARTGTAEARARALHEELCVTETWRRVERLLDWLDSGDPAEVHTAIDHLAATLPIRRCTEGATPAVPPPAPPALAPAIAAIQAERRAIRFGRDRDQRHWIARFQALERRARPLGYLPLVQGLRVDLAQALADAGDFAGARVELDEALRLADVIGDDEERLWTMIAMLRNEFVAGTTDTGALERAADAAARRLGNDAITAELRYMQGAQRTDRGDLAGALAAIREAIRLLEPLALDATGPLVKAVSMLGNIQERLGDVVAARASLDRAYALARRRFGDTSIETLMIRHARASTAMTAGDPAAARDELAVTERSLVASYGDDRAEVADVRALRCQAEIELRSATAATACATALATAERAYPPGHPQLAWVLELVGARHLTAGNAVAAIDPLERALAMQAPQPTLRAELAGYLALALHRGHRDPPRAARLAAEALAALRDDPEHDQHLVAELAAAFPAP